MSAAVSPRHVSPDGQSADLLQLVPVEMLHAPRIPIRLTTAGLNGWKLGRSPRQWKGERFLRPRIVWVVIGPFIGSKPEVDAPRKLKNVTSSLPPGGGWLNGTSEPVGSPRSQAMLSKFENMWQVAHAMSPWPEVMR